MNTTAPALLTYTLLPDGEALLRAAERCRASGLLALDTEFMRVRTFHAQAALFQLFDGQQCQLVDPLAIEDLSPLAALLSDPSVTKIMHSCSEDLEVCARRLGALPEPLIDTQVLAAFCGHGLSVGYQRLVGLELDVELEKSETRTDWLQRPLSDAQLKYAAEDVIYLPRLHAALLAHLDKDPRKAAWAAAECAGIVPRARSREGGVDLAGVGGAWRLDRPRLAALRALLAWRERMARDRDLPRNWVVPDAALLRIAEMPALDERALVAVVELPEAARRRHGKALLAEVAAALALDPSLMPEPVPPPPEPAETRRVKALRAHVVERSELLGVAPEMLAKRRELEELVRLAVSGATAENSPLLNGWRLEAIGESLWRLANASP